MNGAPTDPSADRSASTSVSRRRVLLAGGVAGLAGLAGCTADVGEEFPPNEEWPTAAVTPSLPVDERTTMVAEAIDAAADESIEDREGFAAALDDADFEVVELRDERDVLVLGYVPADRVATGVAEDLGTLAGAYAALVDGGYDAVALAITLLDDAREAYGSAEVETGWAEGFTQTRLTAAEYAEHVLGTVESHRHDPDVAVDTAE